MRDLQLLIKPWGSQFNSPIKHGCGVGSAHDMATYIKHQLGPWATFHATWTRKVDMPNLVNDLHQTPMFEWNDMVVWGSKRIQKRHVIRRDCHTTCSKYDKFSRFNSEHELLNLELGGRGALWPYNEYKHLQFDHEQDIHTSLENRKVALAPIQMC